MWFKSAGFEVGLQVVLFNLTVGCAIYPLSLLVLGAVKSRVNLLVLSLVLAGAALLIARTAVVLFVSWGYSQEHSAYTSAAAVAASKRGLLLVLCSAVVPVLVAVLLLCRRASGQGTSTSAREGSNESAA